MHRGKMVRGEPPRFARVEGLIELPPDFGNGYSGIFTLQNAQDCRPRNTREFVRFSYRSSDLRSLGAWTWLETEPATPFTLPVTMQTT